MLPLTTLSLDRINKSYPQLALLQLGRSAKSFLGLARLPRESKLAVFDVWHTIRVTEQGDFIFSMTKLHEKSCDISRTFGPLGLKGTFCYLRPVDIVG